MRSLILLLLLLVGSRLYAQSDSASSYLLDDPGLPSADIDHIYDYLENSPVTFDSTSQYHLRSSIASSASNNEKGYENHVVHTGSNEFFGGAEAIRNRIWLRSSRFVAAIGEQKKQWEPSFTDRITGYVSLHSPLELGSLFSLEQAVLGSFTMGYGSGLLFGDLTKTNRREQASRLAVERGLRGSLSGDPFFSGFGGAATIGIVNHVAAMAFFSSRKMDARTNGDSIVTLYEFADHRTEEEIAMKNRARFSISGGRIEAFNSDTAALVLTGSLTAYHGAFDHYYSGTESHPFLGKSFNAASIDIAGRTSLIDLRAEVATTRNDTMQRTMLVIENAYTPSKTVRVAVAYRHIPFGIVSPLGRLFGKPVSTLSNQDGYYLGIDAAFIGGLLRASAYVDLASEILPIGDAFARQKQDLQLALHSNVSNVAADLTLRHQRGEETTSDDSLLAMLHTETLRTTTTRLDLHDTVSSRITVRARLQNVLAGNDSATIESGWYGSVGLKYTSPNYPLHVAVDVGRFSTPSYRSAVWLYESSVQGAGRFLALYRGGYYIKTGLQLQIAKFLRMGIAQSLVLYDETQVIGSGLTSRVGNSTGLIAIQLDVLF